MRRAEHNRLKRGRANQAGLLVASAAIPNTFQKTLMPHKTIDQGAITGVTMAVDYLIASTIHKTIEDMADSIAGTSNTKDGDWAAHRRQRNFSLALDLVAIGAGFAGRKVMAQKDEESDLRGIARTGSQWLYYSAIGGASVAALDIALGNDRRRRKGQRTIPVGVIGGALFAGLMEYRRRNSLKNETRKKDESVNVAESIAVGMGVMGVLSAANAGEKYFAELLSSQAGKVLPGSEDFFWSLSRVGALGATTLCIVTTLRKVYRNIEEVATKIEPAYLEPPTSRFVSSGPGSQIDWQSLSVQGRRFVSGAITKENIQTAMGRGPATEPIRVYAGLDSAPSEAERLELVIKELERTKAFDRKMILLCSPTGTGYVNYVAVEAAELMSRGNIATASLQYSKRPSPMSLDRVPEGRLQFRMLVKAVSERIARLPAKHRPELVVFGESLGAWTSQDAFINQGTDGFGYAGIDKALWIGTPFGSKWKDQVLGVERPDVDKAMIGKFDNVKELKKLQPSTRRALKYVMLTHNNDPVALFNLSLLIREPDWLKDPAKRPPTVSHSQYFTTPGTFLLTLIDMGNAMNVVPGKFEANGHDYRADLAEFVKEVFGFAVSDAQLRRIETMLRDNEVQRAARLKTSKRK